MSQVDQVRAAADIVKIVGDTVELRKAGANRRPSGGGVSFRRLEESDELPELLIRQA